MTPIFSQPSFSQTTIETAYHVGALLYTPANRTTVASAIFEEQFGTKFSLALCLEDTINDAFVTQAEQQLILTLQTIYTKRQQSTFYLPKIFIRLRSPQQLLPLLQQLGEAASLVTGFIFPKFSLQNALFYLEALEKANTMQKNHSFYMMPVLEDSFLLSQQTRQAQLEQMKTLFDQIASYVLNVRVGCNDLCHLFGIRRQHHQTIYDILPVSHILSDILTVFQRDYVVSAPVWEYFNDPAGQWKTGLQRELELDLLNGFIGKTVIHPRQIAVVNEGLKVRKTDYDDACQIIGWDQNNPSFVAGSVQAQRMNEYKTHHNWAERTLRLAHIYGVQ